MLNDIDGFITQLVLAYTKQQNASYHEVINEIDIEDLCDYFIFMVDVQEIKKKKDILDKFDVI